MNIKFMRLITIALINVGVLALGGCTSGIVNPVSGSPTVADAYHAAMHGQTTFTRRRQAYYQQDRLMQKRGIQLPVLPQPVHANQHTLETTLNAQFPTLPNPKSVMYVFGHYAGDGEIPVAGHFVPFSLYTRTYYALPNEVLTPYNDGQFNPTKRGV